MKYCSACGAALNPGVRFCSACRASVSVASILASELRSEVKTEVRSILQSPSLQAPLLIWTAVIQFFW
ncbi:MAG: zinc ribbon domain-containing protein, partial [Acidobacteria bacterium]|nr:zinc ribbon domain-containing protein [Acidobacteriota bacterium]